MPLVDLMPLSSTFRQPLLSIIDNLIELLDFCKFPPNLILKNSYRSFPLKLQKIWSCVSCKIVGLCILWFIDILQIAIIILWSFAFNKSISNFVKLCCTLSYTIFNQIRAANSVKKMSLYFICLCFLFLYSLIFALFILLYYFYKISVSDHKFLYEDWKCIYLLYT